MRIVSGKYKRKNLITLESNDTRPTKDMVKEAIFDTIQINEGDSLLDLFAGSGAIGIEAISRGAKAVFNDLNPKAVTIIKQNLTSIKEIATVYNEDAFSLINRLKVSFDYIFIDPPYAFDKYDELIDLIKSNNLLKEGGLIIVEVNKDTVINHPVLKEKKYGISKVLYIK